MRRPFGVALALSLALVALVENAAGAATPPVEVPAATAPGGAPAVARFALVVGNNEAPSAELTRLRYADDDAVRWTMLLRTFGTDVELLTTLDAESARLYAGEAPAQRPPTPAELDAAMARVAARVRAARAAGQRTVFFFVYAGHGDVENDEPFLALAGGRLFRHELEERILAVSPADTNHVVIDACRALYFAYDRGPGGSRRPWRGAYYTSASATRFPNTGFILASSPGGASHEWEEFEAGIFSHELRSGLLGGADANGDGVVTYGELAAFVRVANQEIRNARYRPDVVALAPRQGGDALVALTDASGGRLAFGAGRTGRFALEDGLGVRWADVHPSPRQHVTLALPAASWARRSLFLQSVGTGQEYRFSGGADLELARLPVSPLSLLRRGAIHEAFSHLFAAAFDASSLTAPVETEAVSGGEPDVLVARPDAPPSPSAPFRGRRRAVTIAAAGGGIAGLGLGVAFVASAANLRDANSNAHGDQRPAVNDQIERRNLGSAVSFAAGAALSGLAAYLFFSSSRADAR